MGNENFYTLSFNDDGKIIEYIVGNYTDIFENELVIEKNEIDFGKIEFYRVVDNKLIFNEEEYDNYIETEKVEQLKYLKNDLLKKIKELEKKEKEKPFKFKGYWQPNRELEDQTSLLKIISFMQTNKKTTFDSWKMFNDDLDEVYVTLTIQEMVMLGMLMEQQTTVAMKKFSEIRRRLKNITIIEEFETFKKEVLNGEI